jgi:hypothetical protein
MIFLLKVIGWLLIVVFLLLLGAAALAWTLINDLWRRL